MNSGRWSPGIGDPTWYGWATVGTYVLVAVACAVAARRSPHSMVATRLWWGLVAAMSFLGLNKQLDLQSWLTQTARDMAVSQGWYGEHRAVQAAFITVLGLLIFYAVIYGAWRLRDEGLPERAALAGILLLGGFVLTRAASFHHVDALLVAGWGGLRFNWVFENLGIAIIGFAALARRCMKQEDGGEEPPAPYAHYFDPR